jgi:P pilus assembly chaperone PapD
LGARGTTTDSHLIAPSSTTASAPVSATVSATATVTASLATTTGFARTRLVYDDGAAHKVLAVESLNGTTGFLVVVDFNEAKASRLARELVHH